MPRRHRSDELDDRPAFGRAQMANLGRQIRALRQQRGLALSDLSRASKVSITALRKLEKGDTNPGLLTLVGVLDVLGASLDHVIRLARESAGSVRVARVREGSERARFVEQKVGEIANGHLRTRLLALPPQTDMVAPDRRERGAHFAFVIEGKVRIVLDDDGIHELSAGDAIYAIEPSLRLLSNRTRRLARLLWIDDARLSPRPS